MATRHDDVAAFINAFLTLFRAVYNEAAPERRTNHVGQPFAFEFSYLMPVDFLNAYAFSDASGRLFVDFIGQFETFVIL